MVRLMRITPSWLLSLLVALPLGAHGQEALIGADDSFRLALQGAAHRQLRLTGDRPLVDFPLDPARSIRGLDVVLLEASYGNPPVSAEGIFAVEPLDGPEGARIRVTANPDELRTGAYTLRLRVTAPGADSYEPSVQVTAPAPVLRLPDTLSVQRVRPLVTEWLGPGESSVEPLVIREVSRLAGLSGIQLTQIGPLTHEGRGTVGRLRVDAVPAVAPGGMATVAYDVEPLHLPAGEVHGMLQLTARELDQPIDIPITITSRVDSVWIVALVFAGVLLGYLSRGLLGRWRARSEALALASGERRALAAALNLAGDRAHRTTIEQIRSELDEKAGGSDPQTIVDAVNTARTARIEAREALKQRHEALSRRLEEAMAALSGRPLPGYIEGRVDSRLDQIREALIGRETDRAEALLDDLTAGPDLEALRTSWNDWRLDARQTLSTLDRLGDLSEVDAEAAIKAVQAMGTSVDFGPLFAHGAAAFGAVHQLAAEVWVTVDGAVEEVLASLGGTVDPSLAAGVREVLGRARQTLVDGREPVEALRLMCGELVTGLANAIGAARPGEETRELLAEHRYRAAAAPDTDHLVVPRMPNFQFEEGAEIPESDYDEMPPPEFLSTRPRAPVAPPPGPRVWRRDVAVARLAFDAPPPAPAIDPPDPWLPQLLGSLVNAVVIALVAYVIYADDFIGDGKQLVSTLLWAYGLDLGAEAVKAQLKRVTPTGT